MEHAEQISFSTSRDAIYARNGFLELCKASEVFDTVGLCVSGYHLIGDCPHRGVDLALP